jgi:hypothetical protein
MTLTPMMADPDRISAADGSDSNNEEVSTGTESAITRAMPDAQTEAPTPEPDAEWRHWSPLNDESQPIMDQLLAERGSTL